MIKTTLTLERFSPHGDLLEKREQESRSWLKHFLDLLYLPCARFDYTTNDIGGTPRGLCGFIDSTSAWGTLKVASTPGNTQICVHTASGGSAAYCRDTPQKGEDIGIVVGTGNAAVTPAQDALQTKVNHGEGAGQLLYGGCELYGLTFADPNGQFTIRRYFTNVLGGNITIEEVGIYTPGVTGAIPNPTTSCYIFCAARDLTGGVLVANGELLRVTYVVQITV